MHAALTQRTEDSSHAAPAEIRPIRQAQGRPLAPAWFVGVQLCFGLQPDFQLWHLMADIPSHCCGSTVSRATLERAGYYVPAVAPEVERVARLAARRRLNPAFFPAFGPDNELHTRFSESGQGAAF